MTAKNPIVVVGAGLSGCSVAYYLTVKYQKHVHIIEAGNPGLGAPTNVDIDDENSPDSEMRPHVGGSASGLCFPSTGRMIVQLYPTRTEDFIHINGLEGAKKYAQLADIGRRLEKALANKLKGDDPEFIKENGSVYVCEEKDLEDFKVEFELLKKANFANIRWMEKEEVDKIHGKDAKFGAGISFPDDAIVNCTLLCRKLLEAGSATGLLKISTNSPRLVKTIEYKTHAEAILADGRSVKGQSIVLCTGAHYLDSFLSVILKPCWSYIVNLKADESVRGRYTKNFFTFVYTHDWCVNQGFWRISGEDHHSALKPPHFQQRAKTLAKFLYDKYPDTPKQPMYSRYYGVYGETADMLPIVGKINPSSKVIYCVGCNAWGQSSMSFSAHLVPYHLGLDKFDSTLEPLAEFVSPNRFKYHPSL